MSINRYRLQSMQNAQCHVVIETNEHDHIISATLVSYSTEVLKIYSHKGYAAMSCTGVYSVTTARHINRFTREFCGRNMYFDCKDFVSNRHKYAHDHIELSISEWETFLSTATRYLDNRFSTPVRKYFGKY